MIKVALYAVWVGRLGICMRHCNTVPAAWMILLIAQKQLGVWCCWEREITLLWMMLVVAQHHGGHNRDIAGFETVDRLHLTG